MSLRTPDYLTTEDYAITIFGRDPIFIPKESFVRPIDYRYVPAHTLELFREKGYRREEPGFEWCYTKMGIVPIKTDIIRRAYS